MSAAISVLIAEDDEGHATLMQRDLPPEIPVGGSPDGG